MAVRRLNGLRFPAAAATLLLAAVWLAACGGDQPAPSATSETSTAGTASTAPATRGTDPAAGGETAEARAEARRALADKIITVLPKDRIPSIDFPFFVPADEAGGMMADEELVIGVSIDGDHRAYSVPHLSRHEIVNDVVGGRPIAVTW
jgi:hypothetical protein